MATDLRPDIVWWDDSLKKIVLVELTVCFESSFQHAAQRKTTKYEDVVVRVRSSGYMSQIITLEVGSRGIIGGCGFNRLKTVFNIKDREMSKLQLIETCMTQLQAVCNNTSP